ncbi:ParB N-terminal domain-containing protein [Sulfitobacter pseudonitzschiae]|uniref:ParB N-terminal domain-containing protein n=1 Tax=Pseudosulfitobacter pseudonitzschiae TaxID=1402135 RepID=A0A9Q2RXK1_9RHOB|nr:ParB N-terminal domain-containing protein [Pseudosulfitobacter pseudonitzschiae]MBM2295050.1 ParB N-terminal domain-containing protein [Pseudosulfitobacter pseudonitzschiae]MBM2299964.1 ParB N-terminal domain-containing protein [Pseudosulfitobacter pseudonitzschiae]MBM2304888.1 ParB N-terminal domain-containing protein [Pseudosulfitobacter pseudonitzschiae]MBM2314661.1 ParB N-terminal domain-containing protein [Pseudosulfitobacter pseudonitzschiae]MBM2319571.1 ParB N-terminal domain-contain
MTDTPTPPVPSQTHDLRSITVALIEVEGRMRPARADRIEVLKQDIDCNGLTHPLLVVRKGQKYRLVAGLQRLEAIRALRWAEVPVTVLPEDTPVADLRFAEIMENINREELTKLERAEHLAALKATWEDMNPAARHGGDRRSANVRLVKDAENADENQSPILGLWSGIAEKTGLSRTAFFRAIEIANGLFPSIKDRIRETWIADHQAGLQALAKVPADVQERACDVLLSDPPQASSVADALLLAEGRALPKNDDKHYHRVTATWSRLSTKSRRAFIDEHKREILEHARAQGWSL